MKKSIIAVLVMGSFASVSSNVHAAVSGDFTCGRNDYMSGSGDNSAYVCSRINETADSIDHTTTFLFGGKLQGGFGNSLGYFDKDGNQIIDKDGNIVLDENGEVPEAIRNSAGGKLYFKLDGKIADASTEATVVANDFDKRITANKNETVRLDDVKAEKKDLDNTNKKLDGTTTLLFGGKAHLDSNGNFDGFLNPNGDAIRVDENGKIYGTWSDAGLYGKARSWAAGTDRELTRLDNVKADKKDVEALDGRVTVVEGKITTVENGAKTIVANKDLIINKAGDVIDGVKGNIQTSIDNSINNVVTGGNTEINAKWEGAKEKANDFDERITANKNRIDDSQTRIGKVEDVSAQNKKDIGTLNKETKRLEAVKADKADLEALDGRVTNVEGDVANINGKITTVENGAKTLVANKDLIINKAGDAFDARVDANINAKIEGAKTTIINNQEGIKGKVELAYNGAKTDITNNVLNEIKSGDNSIVVDIKKDIKNEIDNSINKAGEDFSGRINAEVSRGEGAYNELNDRINNINVGNGEMNEDLTALRKDVADSKAAGQAESAFLRDTKADKADLDKAIADGTDALTNLNGKVDTNIELGKAAITRIDNSVTDLQNDLAVVTGDISYVKDNAKTWVDNGKTYVDNTVNTAIDNKVTDIKSNINNTWEQNKVDVINNAQVKLENYTNNVKGDIINEINTSIENTGKDFQDQIDAATAAGKAESEFLRDTKADKSYVDAKETDMRNDGQKAYDDLNAKINNATSPEQIEEILNEYKNRQLQIIREKAAAAKPGAEAALEEAKRKAIIKANTFVNNEINNAIGDVKIAIKGKVEDIVEENKDSVKDKISDITTGGKELNDRVTKIEGQIDYAKNKAGQAKEAGKDAAKKVIAKAPALKGDISAKVNNAKTYVKSIDAKADTAINMGHQNAQDIVTERNDRIQGQRDTLKAANNYTDNKFNSLKNTVEQNRRKAAAGVAGVAAMSNIPALTGDANGSFGMGLGHYDGAQSISAGVQQRFNQNVIGKASFASDDHGNVVVGVGASVQW